MMQEPEIKRWTAKRKAELIKQIYCGQTTVPEAAREHDLTQAEIETWMGNESYRHRRVKDPRLPKNW